MKVVQVTSTFVPNYFGGREVHVQKLSESLASANIDVSIITGDNVKSSEIENTNDNLRVIRLPMYCLQPVRGSKAPYPIILSLMSHVIHEKPDLIHAHDNFYISTLTAEFASIVLRKPFVLTVHGFFHEGKLITNVKMVYDFLFGRLSLFLASAIICVSKSTKEELKKIGIPEEKVKVVYPCVDTTFYSPIPLAAKESLAIVTVGRLIERKGIQYLIKAFSEMQKKYPSLKLVIIGPDGGYRGDLEKLVADMRLSNVSFLGVVSENELRDQMAMADVFVLSSRQEQLPEAMLKAMALAKPVIVSSVGGVPEVIDNGVNGLLVKPGDIKQIEAALDRIFSDPQYAEELGSKGYAVVTKNFSLDKLSANTIKIYQNCRKHNQNNEIKVL